MAKIKSKGTTLTSLYGMTGRPIPGTILEVYRKDPGFDHPNIQQWSYRVLSRGADSKTRVTWFNTYQETLDSGKKTLEYIGDDVNLDRNTLETTAERFRAKALDKRYAPVDKENWPISCRGTGLPTPVIHDDNDPSKLDLSDLGEELE